ncbi:MAG: amidohydrolase family protein, partial [Chloroflexi bacterium]|nr:amidohydrolase family protein [Chloroflexota bacterium]
QVLRMATEWGAQTTPFGDQIGALDPGKAADLVIVNWKDTVYPYLDEHTSIVDAVVQRLRRDRVETVIVAGEPILHQGKFTRLDKAAVLAELADSLRAPLSERERRRRDLMRGVFPAVRDFYRGYLGAQRREPFYEMSARS